MAAGKNSFILHTDLIGTVDKLPDDHAGKLFKTILAYVNDRDPNTDDLDLVIQIAFEPVKQQLKRNLKKWEKTRSQYAEAGKRGGLKSGESRRNKAKRSNASKNEANEAVSVSVNVSDSVSERENTHTLPLVNGSWKQMPGKESLNLELPELSAGAVIQLLSITKNQKISPDQVAGLWTVFKSQHFTGKKFYASREETFSHFINWSKGQKIEETKSKGPETTVPILRRL